MKKSTFVNLLFGVVGGLLFSVGLCMCLLPEWNAFTQGVIAAAIGGVILLVLAVTLRVKSGKAPAKPNWKLIGKIAFGMLGALVLGLGMCMIMVWEMMLTGIAVGIVGIVLLLCLIPMCIGFRN